jgi:hypothetical protein
MYNKNEIVFHLQKQWGQISFPKKLRSSYIYKQEIRSSSISHQPIKSWTLGWAWQKPAMDISVLEENQVSLTYLLVIVRNIDHNFSVKFSVKISIKTKIKYQRNTEPLDNNSIQESIFIKVSAIFQKGWKLTRSKMDFTLHTCLIRTSWLVK